MSTTSYIPWDSDAPSYFRSARTANYVCVAFSMLLLYDHCITLDKEIEWIWTLRWRLPKVIFLLNRYVLTLLIMLTNFSGTIYPLSRSFCQFFNNFLAWSPIFNFYAAELLMIIRVCALYGHRKLVLWPLVGFFGLAFAGSIVSEVMFMRTYITIFLYDFLPGCYIGMERSTTYQWHVWIPSLALEGTLMLLTAYKIIVYRDGMNRTITVLARDSLLYFVVVFVGLALSVANSIHPIKALNFPVIPPTQCIVSIAVGRMVMNIRGLVLDDPDHTVHLQSLQFEHCRTYNSEMELMGSVG